MIRQPSFLSSCKQYLQPSGLKRWKSLLTYEDHNILPSHFKQQEPDSDDEIVVAMSSGVDSSVAAAIYAKKYNNVRGIYMANWSQTAKCTEADWNDVQRICKSIQIPCERVNFEREYWSDVFQPMITAYQQGLTPNPDVGCNKYVKFGKMVEHLGTRLGNSRKWWLVTGHYARIMKNENTQRFSLLRGLYPNKDQSYYLSSVPYSILSNVLMPIGHMTKPEVRQIAKDLDLHVAAKPDSQGLCFVSQEERSFRQFLDEYIEPNPGNIVTEDGKIWGRHRGLWHATIGQKSGISMPQGSPEYKGVWFVSEKRPATNELVIVKGGNHPSLFKGKVLVENWAWIDEQNVAKAGDGPYHIQYRSLQFPIKVKAIVPNEDGLEIEMEEKARAMAPGQSVVLYKGSEVLGSGEIKRALD
ncbi:Mitochondrial tRNA-specific 2-thiouridylase 1 [Meyerozyma sp. JA9]|nr:Mitochondrial tRNA-specific 2-thiouridylase 1 [Meyerozyma sp. JA9]